MGQPTPYTSPQAERGKKVNTNLPGSEENNMTKRLKDLSKLTKLIVIAPLAILGMALFVFIGGQIVLHLWNWLLPPLFGFREITFWQALGILVLSRILFGGFGMHGGCGRGHRRGFIADRVADRVAERCENMTPEERERLRQRVRERWGGESSTGETNPL